MPTYVQACKSRQIRRIDRLPVNAKAAGVAAGVSANAAQYWRPRPANDDVNSTEYVASFRGRKLNGEKMVLPEGYIGYVLNEVKVPLQNEDDRFIVDGTFEEFTYWNWNTKPSSNDPIRRAFEWLDIAEALHEPIDTTVKQNDTDK